MDQARRGDTSLAASNFEEAVKHFTDAISINNRAPSYWTKRSTAYHRLNNFQQALDDAEIAVKLAHDRAQREAIKDAQKRRALALFALGRYGDAERVFGFVKKLDPKEKTLPIWETKIKSKVKDLPEDDARRKVTIVEVPKVEPPRAEAPPTKEIAKMTTEDTAAKPKESSSTPAQVPISTPLEKIRHEFYDTADNVVISIFAKGVPKDKLTVTIERQALEVSFPTSSGSDFQLNLEPLFSEVDPASSTYRVTPTKIEVTLKKVMKGQKWKALESDSGVPAATTSPGSQETANKPVLSSKADEQPPAYPTSSKKGAKNWDKLEDDGEDGDGDETAKFFKTLYAGATPEQQRAMMKSFQESGGTVLSTDWSQVGAKTVTPEPPEGMEAKKWNT